MSHASATLDLGEIRGFYCRSNILTTVRSFSLYLVYTISLRNFVVQTLSMVGDPLSRNGCGSPNHI